MIPFLKQVAHFLYSNHQSDLSNYTIIVPNRRSGVFFTAYLNECVNEPIIAPQCITINELVSELADLELADNISLILALHEIYQDKCKVKEPLDEFFFWGEMLLNDFNDIDKYLLDAEDLFRNIKDLKDIENHFDYLSENQRKAIKDFWGLSARVINSENREKYLSIWKNLYQIYVSFKEQQLTKKMAYTGMMYRYIVENWSAEIEQKLHAKHYCFVGFNALNDAESKLLKLFNKAFETSFFWDYDEAFLHDPNLEAGHFIRKNIIAFPMPQNFVLEGNNSGSQGINIVGVSGQVSQSQVIHHPIFNLTEKENARFDDVAMILADESLLVPVVSASGSKFKNINITMGYPIDNTPVFSFINLLIDLQKNFRSFNNKASFYNKPVCSLLSHQLLSNKENKAIVAHIYKENKIYVPIDELQGSELSKIIFKRIDNWQDFINYLLDTIAELARQYQLNKEQTSIASLNSEYLYQVYINIQRLNDTLAQHKEHKISMSLFYRLLYQYLVRISIPFEGEPLSGMQVMGFLETRNLDFEKVFMFSVNDSRLPSSSANHSYIPYNLRKAFGLPTYEEHDAMYAYYFYRLLNRAKELTLIYNTSSEGMDTGEMSRYLYQLIFESNKNVKQYQLNFDFKTSDSKTLSFKLSQEQRSKLLDKYKENALSPSALNTYMNCKLQFYFKYIAEIKEQYKINEDIDNRLFGNIFHSAIEEIYKQWGNNDITEDMLAQMAENKSELEKIIKTAYVQSYFNDKSFKDDNLQDNTLSGRHLLVASNIQEYIIKMLNNEKQYAPINIIGLEDRCVANFEIECQEQKHSIMVGGTIDRLDLSKGYTRIIDYKTGKKASLSFKSIDELFIRKDKRPKEIFQTLVYAEVYRRLNQSEHPILPCIYKSNEFFNSPFKPEIQFNGANLVYRDDIIKDFSEQLTKLIEELFDSNTVFSQVETDSCPFCPYNIICKKEDKNTF